jgi:hypothetical protein
MTDSLMKSVIDNIIHPEFCINGDTLHIEKIDSIVQSNKFKTKVKEKAIRDKIISKTTLDFIKSKLSSVFDTIQADKEKIKDSFFRTFSKSGPFPPRYYIEKRYCSDKEYDNYDGKKTKSYLQTNITQKNIDDYIKQQKNKYKK